MCRDGSYMFVLTTRGDTACAEIGSYMFVPTTRGDTACAEIDSYMFVPTTRGDTAWTYSVKRSHARCLVKGQFVDSGMGFWSNGVRPIDSAYYLLIKRYVNCNG